MDVLEPDAPRTAVTSPEVKEILQEAIMALRTRFVQWFALSVALVLSSCRPKTEPNTGWKLVTIESLSPLQKEQHERALAARDALFESLMGRLSQAMKEHGVGGAVKVCQEEAPRLAEKISQEKGLRLGRTSFKLRNPKNEPPAWAATLVAARVQQPTTLVHSDGRLAAFLPIQVKTQCLMCHGKTENIPEEVKSALKEHYPNDAATGFSEGDLRGWFWIEVPAK
jgi:cytochrome c553